MGEYIDTRTAAKILGFNEGSLARWRCLKKGPVYYKSGRSVRYKVSDLEAWMEKQKRGGNG